MTPQRTPHRSVWSAETKTWRGSLSGRSGAPENGEAALAESQARGAPTCVLTQVGPASPSVSSGVSPTRAHARTHAVRGLGGPGHAASLPDLMEL